MDASVTKRAAGLAMAAVLAAGLAAGATLAPQEAEAKAAKPAKAKISKVTVSKKRVLTVKVKKANGAKGYQYRITAKGFKVVKKSKKRTLSASVTKAKGAVTVKVRAYNGSGYGAWSKAVKSANHAHIWKKSSTFHEATWYQGTILVDAVFLPSNQDTASIIRMIAGNGDGEDRDTYLEKYWSLLPMGCHFTSQIICDIEGSPQCTETAETCSVCGKRRNVVRKEHAHTWRDEVIHVPEKFETGHRWYHDVYRDEGDTEPLASYLNPTTAESNVYWLKRNGHTAYIKTRRGPIETYPVCPEYDLTYKACPVCGAELFTTPGGENVVARPGTRHGTVTQELRTYRDYVGMCVKPITYN